jgi:hypothetical protein
VCYGAGWALVLAVFAENFAGVWFYYDLFFLECEGASFAEVDAFSAGGAFLVVYGWVPIDLVSWYSFKGFFLHFLLLQR